MITLTKISRKRYPTRRDREEFAWLYRKELAFLERNFPAGKGHYNAFASHPMTKRIAEKAREAFGYSKNYNACDLVWSLRGVYMDLIKIN